MTRKFIVLAVLSGGFLFALGMNCIPNLGTNFEELLQSFGLGEILGGIQDAVPG